MMVAGESSVACDVTPINQSFESTKIRIAMRLRQKMADARIRIFFGHREIIKYSERKLGGVTLWGEAKRETPVRTESHPSLTLPPPKASPPSTCL